MKNFIKEFKEFAIKGNVFDLAIAFILGSAITALVKALVDFILSPIIGLIFGEPDFSAITLGPILIGSFINALIAFVLLAFVLFILVRGINAMKRKEEVIESFAPSSKEEILLAEIRDLLKKQNEL